MTPKRKTREIEIEPPLLPTVEDAHALDHGEFETEGRYSNLLLSDADLSAQTADNIVIEIAHFVRAVLSGSKFKRLRLTDVRFEGSDMSNGEWPFASLNRVEFLKCRLTGLRVVDAKAKDLRFEECKADLTQFRGTVFKDARFEDCIFVEADFREADLKNTVFSGCDLRGAEFYGAQLKGADLRGSQLDGIKFQIDDLKGAIVDTEQLVSLAGSFASLMELVVK